MKKQENFKKRNSDHKHTSTKRSTRGRSDSYPNKLAPKKDVRSKFAKTDNTFRKPEREATAKRDNISFRNEKTPRTTRKEYTEKHITEKEVKDKRGFSKNTFHLEKGKTVRPSQSSKYPKKEQSFDRKRKNASAEEDLQNETLKKGFRSSGKVPFTREYKPKTFSKDESSKNGRNSRGVTRNFDRKNGKPGIKSKADSKEFTDGSMRLNKYLSNAGIASRRDADTFITAGLVSVNGKIVTELGVRVMPSDEVRYNGSNVRRETLQYFLMNKPKDYICTTDDPYERKTVMELAKKITKDRIYPVGRLDRNTTGLLLMTNDGEMAQKLMHPKTNVKKIYQVELNKNFKKEHFDKLLEGIELEDGFIKPDEVAYDTQAMGKKIVGVTMHSGRNRIVRRMFEHFDYEVVKLDRVYYGGLTKKDLPRGHIRPLTQIELSMLKMVSKPK